MLLLPTALVSGLLLGRACGGRIRALAAARLRLLPLALVALAAQLVLGAATSSTAVPGWLRSTIVLSSSGLVGWWLMANIRRRPRAVQWALALLAGGWAANTLVIGLNGAMPVARSALGAAGLRDVDVASGHLGKHLVAAPSTRLAVLSDWIPLKSFGAVVSPGDLAMLLGVVLLVAALMFEAGEVAAA